MVIVSGMSCDVDVEAAVTAGEARKAVPAVASARVVEDALAQSSSKIARASTARRWSRWAR